MDNLINDKIEMLIMTSMKNHDTTRTQALRTIKNAFTNWKTNKQNIGKEINTGVEIQILNSIIKGNNNPIEENYIPEREKYRAEIKEKTEEIEKLKAEIVSKELEIKKINDFIDEVEKQNAIIKEYIPAEATEEDILKCFNDVIGQDGFELTKNNMSIIIKTIKAALPTANGGLVAQIVKSKLQ